jgi:hypothetical protein
MKLADISKKVGVFINLFKDMYDVHMFSWYVVVLPATTSSATCYPPLCRWQYLLIHGHYNKGHLKMFSCYSVCTQKLSRISTQFCLERLPCRK